nr:virulence factor TspB C-terminal domain-related protein [uncultured Roseateles sp.]
MLLVLASGLASAQITYTASGAIVPPAPANTLGGTVDFERFIREVTGGGADVVDRYSGKIGNKSFPVEGARRLPGAAVGRVAARVLLNPYVIAGVVITAGAAATFCKVKTGSLVCDDTQPKQTVGLWSAVGGFYSTPTAAYEAYAANYLAGVVVGSSVYKVLEGSPSCSLESATRANCGGLAVVIKRKDDNGVTSTIPIIFNGMQRVDTQACPAAPGYGDPRYAQAGGPANWEGRCPKGVDHVPTEDELAAKLAPVYPPAQHKDVLQEALEKKIDVSPLLQPQVVTGPASVTQAPVTSTTTSPTGTPQTTTTTTTNNITYEGSTFNWTTVNNTSYPDGSTKSETKPPEDKKSECEMNPDTVGCQKLDAPDAQEIGKRDITVSFQPDAGWGASDASCPPPRVVSVLGQQIAIDNTLVCQFMGGIRFAVIGVSALVAGLIFIGGFRGQS